MKKCSKGWKFYNPTLQQCLQIKIILDKTFGKSEQSKYTITKTQVKKLNLRVLFFKLTMV